MYLTKDRRVNVRQPTSPSPSSLPPQDSQFQQSSSRDTLPLAAPNRESDANQLHDIFYASPGHDSESIRTSSGGIRPEARRQLSDLSRPASIRAPSEVIRSTDYASGSSGGYSGESSSQNLLAPVDPTDLNKTRALRNHSLWQFDIELRTLIEKAGWYPTKQTLFKNPMSSVLELMSMVRNSWNFARAGDDFPAELSTGVFGQAKAVIGLYYGLAGMTGEQAKDRVDYLLTDDRFNYDTTHCEAATGRMVSSIRTVTAVSTPSFIWSGYRQVSLLTVVLVIFERHMHTWKRSFPDDETSNLVLKGIRHEILKRIKRTNCCTITATESREAIIDPGVGNFLEGLRSKLSTETDNEDIGSD
ncbi:uncharacterized protein H6S33_007909 [Morchella sextelata]|uniref:uncharacterized protein n=1 Tax=Morchella sextelata TaxID=1174677 RepID=UPI001D04F463|nr:uncharacterized protein H6S33_007909 [Morchella sextelata]KAH0603587.1 hypothetical protein H6S33_007909 [Morchella sextelata]